MSVSSRKTNLNINECKYENTAFNINITIILKQRINTQILLNNGVALNNIRYMNASKSIYDYSYDIGCGFDQVFQILLESLNAKSTGSNPSKIIQSVLYYNDIKVIDLLYGYDLGTLQKTQKIIYNTNTKKYNWKRYCNWLHPDIQNIVDVYLGYTELEELITNYSNSTNLMILVDLPMIFIDQNDMIGYNILKQLIQSYDDSHVYKMINAIGKFVRSEDMDDCETPSAIISYNIYKHMRNGYTTIRCNN